MHYYGGNMMKTPLSGQTHPYRGTKPPKQPQRDQRPEPGINTVKGTSDNETGCHRKPYQCRQISDPLQAMGRTNTEGEGQQGNAELNANNQTAQAKTQWRLIREAHQKVVPRQSVGLARSQKNLLQECGKPSSW